MTRTLKIFVSYTKADEAIVHQVVSDIQAHGFEVRFAPSSLAGGERISEVSTWLEECDQVLIMLSTSSVNSHWVRHEMNTAIALHLNGRNLKVIPVLLERITRPTATADFTAVDFWQGEYPAKLQRLLAAINGEPAPADPFRRFQSYVNTLVRVDSDTLGSVLDFSASSVEFVGGFGFR
jgi:hypothetical protein